MANTLIKTLQTHLIGNSAEQRVAIGHHGPDPATDATKPLDDVRCGFDSSLVFGQSLAKSHLLSSVQDDKTAGGGN